MKYSLNCSKQNYNNLLIDIDELNEQLESMKKSWCEICNNEK